MLHKMMRKRLAASLNFALILLANPAWAARPFVTDDARVVDKGHCQLETFTKSQRAYAGSEFWFLPACNPSFVPYQHGVELTLAYNRIESDHNGILQAKTLLKPLETNGMGFAFSVGVFGGEPFFNGIGSFSFLDDRSVIHTNLGAIKDHKADLTRGTWGIGLEQLLYGPRVYGILETYGQRGEKPTLHAGFRFWVVPNKIQIDATMGEQQSSPVRRFNTIGLRLIF